MWVGSLLNSGCGSTVVMKLGEMNLPQSFMGSMCQLRKKGRENIDEGSGFGDNIKKIEFFA